MKVERIPGMEFILVLTPDPARIAWLREALKAQAIVVDAQAERNALLQQINDEAVRMLVVDCGAASQKLAELAETVIDAYPNLVLVGMGGADDRDAMVTAMRLKAVDFIQFESANQSVVGQVSKLLVDGPILARQRRRRSGKLLAIVSGHPGAGASTLAVNLAHLLSRAVNDLGTLLLDFGDPVGDCMTYLGLPAKLTFTEGLQNLARCDRQYLHNGIAQQHGLAALPLFSESSEVRSIRPAEAFQFLGLLGSHYGLVVADLGGAENGLVSDYILRQADQILVVAEQSITSVLAVQSMLPRLKSVAHPDRPPGLIVNRYDPAVGLSSDYLSKTYALPIWAVLPERRAALLNAANSGQLVAEAASRDAWVKSMEKLIPRLGLAIWEGDSRQTSGIADTFWRRLMRNNTSRAGG